MKHLKTCTFCRKKVYRIAARGLCANCYYREKRNGTPSYQDRSPKPCSVDGCEALAIAKGYCDKHYRRWKRDGDPLSERSERWGHSTAHPLMHSYKWARKRGVVPEWKDDFWTFVRDVGDRPSKKHRLERIDSSQPLGPDNFAWRDWKIPIPVKSLEDRAAYARAYRVLNPEKTKSSELKRMFGITLDDYERILKKQGGVCAICDRKESKKRFKYLAVDHCHESKNIRGLLCSNCNRGLGLFADSIERLKSATKYLRRNGA